MTKREFLMALGMKLYKLPDGERQEQLDFYGEMIDDRMEEGLSEAAAVAAIGSVSSVAETVEASRAEAKQRERYAEPRRGRSALSIVLLILGSPVWLSLLIAAFAVVAALYAAVLAVVISLWAAFLALLLVGVIGLPSGVLAWFFSGTYAGAALASAALVCVGLAILIYYLSLLATKGAGRLARLSCRLIKRCFSKKERI